MRGITTAIACAIVMQGCAHLGGISNGFLRQCDQQFYVYPAGTSPERQAILSRAFGYWNGVAGRYWLDGGALADDVTEGDGYAVVKWRPTLDHGACGVTKYSWKPDGCMAKVVILLSEDCASRYTPGAFETVARHEIGHAMGFDHASHEEELMFPVLPGYGFARELSDAELEEVRTMYPGVAR